jgi:hypothetical protein
MHGSPAFTRKTGSQTEKCGGSLTTWITCMIALGIQSQSG